MSGPKSSTVSIDLAWERELARQRAEAEARRQEELAVERAQKRIKEIDISISNMLKEISSFLNETLDKEEIAQVNQGAVDAIRQQKQSAISKLQDIQRTVSPHGISKDLEAYASLKERKALNVKNDFMTAVKSECQSLKSAQNIVRSEEILRETQQDFASIQASYEVAVFDFDIQSVTNSDTLFEQLVIDALHHCRARQVDETQQKLCSTYARMSRYLSDQIENGTVAANKYTISEELNKLKADEEYYHKRSMKMYLLREEYEALCSLADIEVFPASHFSDPDAYIREIAYIREQYKNIDEREYIADTIDEVMEEFGYRPIETEIMDDGQISYVAEDETVLTVYTGADNSIMIETAVIASEDAADDEEYAYEAQLAFCSMHPQIVARLAEKGIRFKQKAYAPPNKVHNRIISTNKETVQKASANKAKSNRRRIRRGTKLQQMS